MEGETWLREETKRGNVGEERRAGGSHMRKRPEWERNDGGFHSFFLLYLHPSILWISLCAHPVSPCVRVHTHCHCLGPPYNGWGKEKQEKGMEGNSSEKIGSRRGERKMYSMLGTVSVYIL